MAIQTLTLNVNAQPSAEDRAFLYLSQNENGRDIRFRVLGDDLPSGCTATLSGVKPDGNVWSKAGTVTNNFVVVEEDIQMTAVAGRWDAQLDIVNGSKNIVTALIRITVEAAAVEAGAVPSDTQLEGYVEQCKQYAETAKNEAYGSPLTAATAAAMTDQSRVYVYTGSETGYTAGHWYYYNGTSWTDGGVYNAVAVDTDTTLSVSGKAADAKKTGDELSTIKEDLTAVSLDNLSQREWVPTFTADRYIGGSDGKLHTSTKYTCTALWTGTGMRDAVAITGNTYELAVFFYGENGRIQTGDDFLGHSAYVSNGVIVYIPTSAVLIALTARRIDQEVLTDTDRTAIQEALVCYQSTAKKVESGLDTMVASKAIDKSGGTIKDVYIGYSTGKVQTSSQTVKTLCITCAPNTVYKVSHPLSTQFVIASYANEPVVNSIANKVYNGREEKETVFSTDASAKWLGIYYYSSSRNPDVTPEDTYDALTIATIGFDELAETVSVLAKTEAQQEGTYGFYTSNETLEMPTTFEGVIEMYDALVAERPDYVTKNTLTSGDVTNYEYVFTSGDYNRDPNAQRSPDAQIDKPVVLLSSGIHGYERSAVISLYKLMRDMCGNNYALSDLINYVTIKVIPVGCPWGYTNNSRLNANGVNINRNFATSTWGDYDPGSPGSSEYAGPSAGSEDETKILQAWMTANSDALFYVDFHNSNFTNEVAQLSGSDETDSMVFKKRYLLGLNKIIPYWQKARGIDSANNYYCYTGGDGTNEGRVSRNYAYEAGVHLSFSHETSWNINSSGKHSQVTLNVGAEVMGNFLLGMKGYYKDI